MPRPYSPGQALAWLTPDPDGIRVSRAVVESIEPADDDAHWRVHTDLGVAVVDSAGVAANVVPLDVDLAYELYNQGGSYVVGPTSLTLDQIHNWERTLEQERTVEQDLDLDLDGDLGLD
jgi:hypothetical protein